MLIKREPQNTTDGESNINLKKGKSKRFTEIFFAPPKLKSDVIKYCAKTFAIASLCFATGVFAVVGVVAVVFAIKTIINFFKNLKAESKKMDKAVKNCDLDDVKRCPNPDVINTKNKEGLTPLMEAESNFKRINRLLKTNEKDEKLLADKQKVEGIIRHLLENGARVDIKDHAGCNVLMYAAESNNTNSARQYLMRYPEAVLKTDIHNNTALTIAAACDGNDLVKLFIEYGADIFHKNNSGMSAMKYAIKNSNPEMVSCLTSHGAVRPKEPMMISHKGLKNLMKRSGINLKSKGVCYGFAHMLKQAYLTGDITTFDQRLMKLTSDDVLNDLKLNWDDQAFLQGIYLAQDADYLSALYGEQVAQTSYNKINTLTSSIKLGCAGGHTRYMYAFSGKRTQVTKCLKDLLELIKGYSYQKDPKNAVFFDVSSISHATSIGIDEKGYYVADINAMTELNSYKVYIGKNYWKYNNLYRYLKDYVARTDKSSHPVVLSVTVSAMSIEAIQQFQSAAKSKMQKHFVARPDLHDNPLNFDHSQLRLAAREGDFKLVYELLANKKLRTNFIETLNYNNMSGFFSNVAFFNEYDYFFKIADMLSSDNLEENLEKFIDEGKNINHEKKGLLSALFKIRKILKFKSSQEEKAAILTELNQLDDKNGMPPEVIAAKHGQIESLETLLRSGYLDQTNTALWLASENGHLDCIKLLVKHKADINARNADGKTALQLAKEKGHIACENYLSSLSIGKNNNPTIMQREWSKRSEQVKTNILELTVNKPRMGA